MDYTKAVKELLEKIAFLVRAKSHRAFRDFSKGEMPILNYLFRENVSARPSELSALMHISSARTAAILNSLEAKRLVTRRADVRDKRRTIVDITDEGRRKVTREHEILHRHVARVLTALGDTDTKELIRIVGRIADICQMDARCEHRNGHQQEGGQTR